MSKIYAFSGLILILLISPIGQLQAEQAKKLNRLYIEEFEFEEGLLFTTPNFDGAEKYFQAIEIAIPPEARGTAISVQAIVTTAFPGCTPCGTAGDYVFFSSFNFFGPNGGLIQNHGKDPDAGDNRDRIHAFHHQSSQVPVEGMNRVVGFHDSWQVPIFLNWSTVIPVDAPFLQLLIGLDRSPLDDDPSAIPAPLRLLGVLIEY